MTPKSNPAADPYALDAIVSYRDMDHVGLRSEMYIGSSDTRGLHYILRQRVVRAVEETRVNSGSTVTVDLLEDGGCRVVDEGPGLPTDIPLVTPQGFAGRPVPL